MRFCIVTVLAVLLFASCKEKPAKPSPFTLKTDVMLPTTPVKDQGASSLCWDYAMLATIETERLTNKDSVNLSPHYIARYFLLQQAERYYLSQGKVPVSLRGMGSSLVDLMQVYGIMPYDSYKPRKDVNYMALASRIEQMGDAAIAHHDGLETFSKKVENLLNEEIGYMPKMVFMLGATYTPKEFAHSVCMKNDYVPVTSFSNHPFGEKFMLELPDNVFKDDYLNVSLDSLVQLTKSSLEQGHPVFWEGDISNKHFKQSGICNYHPDKPVTQQERQKAIESFSSTDDHAMALVGLAHDTRDNVYFIAKNSWGKESGRNGYFYFSEQYFRIATMAIMLKSEMLDTQQ